MTRAMVVVVVLLSACGDGNEDDPPGSGSQADAAAEPVPDGGGEADAAALPVDGGGIDAGGDADAGLPPDAGSGADAAPGGMIIDSVVLDGSYGQVPQGSEFQLVVTGSGLAGVTDVLFDDGLVLYPDQVVVTETEVRVDLMWVLHGAEPGPRDLTLVGADGAVTAPDALEITPYVILAGASPGGRGTYEVPMSLCDPQLEGSGAGDILDLSAGEHVCPYVLTGQVGEVRGAGIDATLVRTAVFQLQGFEAAATTSIHDLRVVAPGADPGAFMLSGSGTATLRDLRFEGVGVEADGIEGLVTVERVAIDGLGAADCLLVRRFRGLIVSNVDLARCRNGIALTAGEVLLTDVTIAESEIGLVLGLPYNPDDPNSTSGSLTRVDLVDNQTGILQGRGQLSLTDVEVRSSSVAPGRAEIGFAMGSGYTTASRLSIRGMSRYGVDLYTNSGGDSEYHSSLGIADSLIEGGEVGVDVRGSGGGATLYLTRSIVRDQTVASVRIDGYRDSLFSLEDNELSVVSGYAIDDVRTDVWFAGAVVEATGTTLNGNSYAGQLIQGPATIATDLRIADNDAFAQF